MSKKRTKKKTVKRSKKVSRKKTKTVEKRGRGRPPTREGNEIRKTVYLDPQDAAHLEGLIEFRKSEAVENDTPLGEVSETAVLAEAWIEYYKQLPRAVRNAVAKTEAYHEMMKYA